jgi:hypothetical protein
VALSFEQFHRANKQISIFGAAQPAPRSSQVAPPRPIVVPLYNRRWNPHVRHS